MVNNIVHGTYTETYDLNTAVGELSMLGIHTPQAPTVKRMFKGFFLNYKKFKILGCNFNMVCASEQSLTPDLVGQEAGKVDPRDVLNPILFKACTGESINELVDSVYNKSLEIDPDYDQQGQANASVSQVVSDTTAAKRAYYVMLADDSWRKSHPQRGLTVMGLKPMVHKVVTTQPFKWTGTVNSNGLSVPTIGSPTVTNNTPAGAFNAGGFGGPVGDYSQEVASGSRLLANPTVFVSNGMTDMPWLETTTGGNATNSNDKIVPSKNVISNIPRVWCGCIILPPAILQRLYFRMTITWHILWKDFRPSYEVGPIDGGTTSTFNSCDEGPNGILVNPSQYVNEPYFNYYHSDYDPGSKLNNEFSSFATTETTEAESVMQKVA